MVNKVALGILTVIVLTAMTVGGLVGLQLSGDDAPGETTPTPVSTPESGTPGTNDTGENGGDAETTPTATPTPTPSPASRFDEAAIEEGVRAEINVRREDRDMKPLRGEDVIREMARNHSRTMAEEGNLTHDAGGLTTLDRYEAFDLDDRCRIPDNSNTGIRDGKALETLDRKTVGQNYTFRDGSTATLDNETVVAGAVVDSWFTREQQRRKLLLRDAREAGVGAVITDEGEIYVTVDLC